MLYLITGPPAAGKTTWVREHAKHGDITIDYDAIANTLTPVGRSTHEHPTHVQAVTKAARQAAIDKAIELSGVVDVYVIQSMPSPRLLEQYRAKGAQVITIDPGRDVVLARCKAGRPWRITQAAKHWYGESSKHRTPPSKQSTPDGHAASGADTTRQW